MNEHYYHMFANGDDAKNFITSEKEFRDAFNRFGLCQFLTGVTVLSFSIEDSHPHSLLKGSLEVCNNFKDLYSSLSIRSIAQRRGSADGVSLNCELLEVNDEQYLLNVASYTITQATKDGKPIMPYDYRYGTGSLYFRSKYAILPWLVDENGHETIPVRFGELTAREKRMICPSRKQIPDEWLVCNGFILPDNFIAVKEFENIFKTHNCFRYFLATGKAKDTEILAKMSKARGVKIDYLEARSLCSELCITLFGKASTRHLDTQERITLARNLRQKYLIAFNQLAFLTHIPEIEIRKYVK